MGKKSGLFEKPKKSNFTDTGGLLILMLASFWLLLELDRWLALVFN